MKSVHIRPRRARVPGNGTAFYRWLFPEIVAIVSGLDPMPAHEIRALGKLFMDAAALRDEQPARRSA